MISPLASIHPESKIGNNVRIDPFAVIEENVIIGDNSHIMSHAVIMSQSIIGESCTIFPGAVIGGIPQDLKYDGEETQVIIGKHTTIRECVTINRGTIDKWKTTIGENCLLMAYCHVAHDCIIGDHVIIANSVQLAGHVEVGDYAVIGGLAAAIQFSRIGAHTYIAGSSEIIKDIPPFIKAGRSPLGFVGINSVGLQRRGYSTERIQNIQEIYRIIYLRHLNVTQAISTINTEIADSPDRQAILDFIHESKKGILKLPARENGDY